MAYLPGVERDWGLTLSYAMAHRGFPAVPATVSAAGRNRHSPRAYLVTHPEAGDAEADDAADAEREERREAAVELGDVGARVASEEDAVRHEGYEQPGDDVCDVVLLREQRGERDERRA